MKDMTRILPLLSVFILFSCGGKTDVPSKSVTAPVAVQVENAEVPVPSVSPPEQTKPLKQEESVKAEGTKSVEVPEDQPEVSVKEEIEPAPVVVETPTVEEPQAKEALAKKTQMENPALETVPVTSEPESLWLTLIPYHKDAYKIVPSGVIPFHPEPSVPSRDKGGDIFPENHYAVLPEKWRSLVLKSSRSPGFSPGPLPPEGEEPLPDAEEPVQIAIAPPDEASETPESAESPIIAVAPSDKASETPESAEPPIIAVAPPVESAPEIEQNSDTPAEVEPGSDLTAPEPSPALEGGPQIVLSSPQNQDYYKSSLLLEGQCLPGEGLDKEDSRVRTMTWKIPGMGDWSNPVFMEEDGSFQVDLMTSSLEGPQVLILESEDFAGRISRQSVELQDGNQPPAIQLENGDDTRSYGALLSIKGSLKDPYAGIPGLEGYTSLQYRIVPQDRSSENTPLTGSLSIDSSGQFFSAVNMRDRIGKQVLQLVVVGNNGSRSTKQISLVPGVGDIPSFALEPQDGRLSFRWEEIPGALEQNLYISDDPDSSPEDHPTAQFSSIQSPLVVDGTVNGHRYKAKLEILTEAGHFWSEVIEGIPLAPGTLDLTAQGGFEQVKLSWKKIPGADRFRIWRRSESEKEFSILVSEVTGQEFIDATATFGTTYYYRIEPSGVSAPISFSVPASSVETPSDKITLSSNYRQIIPEKITVQGDYAYVAAGDEGFHILDISTPQKPVNIGFLDQPGVKDVYIGPEYVYLASGDHGFQVVNIEEPTKPYIVISRVTSDAVSIVGKDNLVYVADSRMGLQIFDISDRQNPERLSSFREADIKQLDLQGSTLYAATGEGGMILLDISNPYVPKVSASFTDYPVYDILLQNGMIYLACGGKGMVILKEKEPGQWRELSRYPSKDARMIRLWEDYAMIADGRGGMKAVDISQPSDPRFFGSYTGTDIKALAMSDEYALLADVSGLKVVRTYLFGQSFVQNNWKTPGRCYGVMSEGNHLWIADRQGGVSVYQADSPSRMNPSSFLRNFPTEFAEDILIKDDVLYVADGPGGLKLFRLSDSSPDPFLNVPLNGRIRRILPFGSQIAVLSSEEGLIFMDESQGDSDADPSLTFASRFYSSDPRDAVFSGDTLFLGDARDGLIVAQKLDNQFFELERFADYKEVNQLLLAGNVLYVLHSKGVSLLDVRNPESPQLLAFIPSTEAESMQMDGDLLYLAEGFRGISVYRIGSDSQPLKVSVCEDVFAVDAAPRGDYVYVADMDGVSVVKIIIPDWK